MAKLRLDVSRPCVCPHCGRGFSVTALHAQVRKLQPTNCFCPFCGALMVPAYEWQEVPKVWTLTAQIEAQKETARVTQEAPGVQYPNPDPIGHNKPAHQRPKPAHDSGPDPEDTFWSSIFGDDFPAGRKR